MGNTYGHVTFTDDVQAFIDRVNKDSNVQLLPEVRDNVLVGWDVSTDYVTRIYLNCTDPRKAFQRFENETSAVVEWHASEDALNSVLALA
jgi:hypothetical protein